MKNKTFTLAEVAELTRSKLIGNPHYLISNVADLDSASSEDASFLASPRYEQAMKKSEAGVVFVDPSLTSLPEGRNFLVAENPSQAFQKLIEIFHDPLTDVSGFEKIHSSAVIHHTAKLGKNITIGPHVIIDQYAVIGDNTIIQGGCFVGPYVNIGTNCFLHPHVVIRERCILRNRVILQPGAVIGSCGFGYIMNKEGKHIKLNQIGYVVLEDDVEIGANATIDRARFKVTRIAKGTKIDNLVQIAHGVQVGEDNIIIAQTGIAGSTTTGKHVIIAGQVAVNGHISIGDGVIISARSGVSKSLPKAGKYGGVPVVPLSEHNRTTVLLKHIGTYIDMIKELKRRLDALENANLK